jgi:hypothetical protein
MKQDNTLGDQQAKQIFRFAIASVDALALLKRSRANIGVGEGVCCGG